MPPTLPHTFSRIWRASASTTGSSSVGAIGRSGDAAKRCDQRLSAVKQRRCGECVEGTRVEEALRVVDAERAHPVDLVLRLEAFDGHRHAEAARQRGDGADDLVA